ncbi:MAG: arginyltransferase [bacterium]|nr:arginyltransferase [bacterium]
MFQLLREVTGSEEDCVYLPGRRSRMRYRLIDHCTAEDYQDMLVRGWRRFGRVFFRPACSDCVECRSLRIDVAAFAPNRSMRRTSRHNRDLRVVLGPASISRQHLELYGRYHHDMSKRKGWSEKTIDPSDYHQTFVQGREDFGHELLILDGDKLLAVTLVDLLPRAVSAVYCFYEPEERPRALGVFSVLRQIELARDRGADRVYLGYWVADNESMRYKAGYHPHEILAGRPEHGEEAAWRPTAWSEVDSAADG